MKEKLSGKIFHGEVYGHQFIAARSESNSEFHIPLIRSMFLKLNPESTIICDFGPGNNREVSFVLSEMDLALVVLKPVPEWKANLEAITEFAEKAGIPTGLILNSFEQNNSFLAGIQAYCAEHVIPLLGIIPYLDMPEHKTVFKNGKKGNRVEDSFASLFDKITKLAGVHSQIVTENLKIIIP